LDLATNAEYSKHQYNDCRRVTVQFITLVYYSYITTFSY